MFVYFSTVFRTAPIDQGGELVKLDWTNKRIVARTPIVPADPIITDPNPRGGTRGGRGIILERNRVSVASYHTIHEFDRDLQPIRRFSNSLLADVHEIVRAGTDMWVSSTVIDGLIKLDNEGRELDSWWPREDSVLAERFQLKPLPIDKTQDNRLSYLGRSHVEPCHTHLNAVAMLDGRPLVMLNQQGCLVQLHPTRILVESPRLRGAHNICVTADRRILVNDTWRQEILVFDEDGALEHTIDIKRMAPVKRIRRRFALRGLRLWLGEQSPSFKIKWWLVGNIIASRPVFVRGLCLTPRGTALVGISPATILEIDLSSGRLVDHFEFSRDVNIAVHGLECDQAARVNADPTSKQPAAEAPERSVDRRRLVPSAIG